MDPVSILSLTGSVLTTGKVATNTITSLVTLKSKYKSASLMTSLLIGQLTTIKAALNEVSNWIATALQGVDKSEQLIVHLESSLESCHVFFSDFGRSHYPAGSKWRRPTVERKSQCSSLIAHGGTKVNIRSASNTKKSLVIDICYLNCVDEQNSRTSFDRNQLLQKPESQKVFKKVEDDGSSLSAFRSRSGTSAETSGSHIAFDFDKEIATTNVYRNVATSPEMTRDGPESISLPRSKKKTNMSQNSKQRRPKLPLNRTSEWCFEQTVPSDCDSNLPNSRPTSIDEKISTMDISNNELRSTTFEWQSEKQRSSTDIIDNPFLDPEDGSSYLPIHSLHENSSDTSNFHKKDGPCPRP
ncbi:uncharacterized protein EAF01_003055 [Botrytis porri]|uniref:uncharacterized protein n=1 Tax=Botrytis porri TaxID=87229 RepID=UPI0019028B50|nr:uncharacterized protein EAF01_003055 [Botrytis porri]KAF7909337.1 hypothetical protein EAF01_003055 [Botrytis porri]